MLGRFISKWLFLGMRNWGFIILITFLSCGSEKKPIENIEEFNTFLGQDRSEMLSVLNHSFDTILQSAYPDIPDFPDRIFAFLDSYSKQNDFETSFFTDSTSFISLKNQLENSGFRKDFYLYEGENTDQQFNLDDFIPERDEPEPIDLGPLDLELIEEEIKAENKGLPYDQQEYNGDSLILFSDSSEFEFYINSHGKFWYGIGKYSCSIEIIGVLESINNENHISLAVVAGGMKDTDLNNPFIRQVIMAQFYIPAILRFGYSESPK